MENVNRLNINNEIESAIKKKKLPTNKNAAPSQVNYTKHWGKVNIYLSPTLTEN